MTYIISQYISEQRLSRAEIAQVGKAMLLARPSGMIRRQWRLNISFSSIRSPVTEMNGEVMTPRWAVTAVRA